MERHALVIEDKKNVLEGAVDQILSIGDNCEVVSSQQEGQKFFLHDREKFDYMVCDLEMRARPDSPSSSCQNGIRFIKLIRRITGMPFFFLASSTLVCQGYAVKAMKLGANDVIADPLPPMGRPLGRAVEKTFDELLPGFSKNFMDCPPQQLDGGLIVLTSNGIEINGVFICDYQELSCAGKIFVKISEVVKEKPLRFVNARELAELLGVSMETLFMIIRRLRERIVLRLKEANILCGQMQVLQNCFNRGYYVAPEFEICDNRGTASPKAPAVETPQALFEFSDVTDPRELWILEQLCKSRPLRRQDVEKQFSLSAKMAGRFLTRLQHRGIIEFCGNGNLGYWKMVDAQRAKQCAIFPR